MKNIVLTMNDVKQINHNLDGLREGDFMDNYGWNENKEITVCGLNYSEQVIDGKKIYC